MLIVEMKSEAVKERHWNQLMRRLRVNWVLSELTLGHLWDIGRRTRLKYAHSISIPGEHADR